MIIRMLSVRHGRKEGLHGSIGSGAGRDLFPPGNTIVGLQRLWSISAAKKIKPMS